ncbi:hypothetical protein GXP67_27510 [Rhodocytophaga rosea]|uniref:tRNA (Guanine-N1)-methyltransferase n=1 Tax=Rhodocytophaga rosea TaxID=2704465 RepID=A0A6C0GQC2_9BACT|nr:hypothetical protein [Rhodocytophaga rosea]QHT70127.1 hypothetical protein GXP67_27510 [Rhodocytophaga rosea]
MKTLFFMKWLVLTLVILTCSQQAILAQNVTDSLSQQKTAPKPKVEYAPTGGNNSLAKQFFSLRDKSNSYQEYKVIKQTSLNTFWKNVQDTLTQARKQLQAIQGNTNSQLQAVQAKMDGQQAELTRLKSSVAERDEKLKTIAYNTDRINVFGLNLLKDTYIYLNIAIISILVLLLGGAIYKYKDSNKVAVSKVNEFETVKSELNGCRQKLRERETVMGRELQTERNKIEELNQTIASLKKKVH